MGLSVFLLIRKRNVYYNRVEIFVYNEHKDSTRRSAFALFVFPILRHVIMRKI